MLFLSFTAFRGKRKGVHFIGVFVAAGFPSPCHSATPQRIAVLLTAYDKAPIRLADARSWQASGNSGPWVKPLVCEAKGTSVFAGNFKC